MNLTATTSLHVKKELKNISYSTLNEEYFAYKLGSLHHDATKCWHRDQKGAKLIITPFIPEDETINKGAAKVVLYFLVLFGILENILQEGATQNNINQLQFK